MSENSFALIKDQLQYLYDRGFDDRFINKFKIELLPSAARLEELKFPKRFTDHVEKAILIPIYDIEGEIVDYSARVWYRSGFVDNSGLPKLLCLADSAKDKPASVHFSPTTNWLQLSYESRIFVCESVLKAEVVSRLGFPAIGVNGCWGFSKNDELHWDFKKLPWDEKRLKPFLFMDSNVHPESENKPLRAVAPRFSAMMDLECGAQAFHIVLPKGEDDWGCDDYTKVHGLEALKALLLSNEGIEIKTDIDRYIERLNTEVVLIRDIGEVYDRKLKVRMGIGHFQTVYANWKVWGIDKKPIPLPKVWLESKLRNVVDTTLYEPGQGEINYEANPSYYNIWPGFGLEPIEGDASPFLDWVEKAFAVPTEREYLLDWLAYPIQNPGKKMNSALILVGPSGTGKGFLCETLTRIYGKENVWSPPLSTLENDFNAGIAKAQMVIMQEADQKKASDKVYNRLKDMITSETVRLEPKGVDARMVPARFNFMLQSNHIDVLPLEAFDRRFFVAEIANKELENNIPYFDPKFQWMRAEGAAIIMNWLLKRDLSSFNPAAQPPMTEAKLRMRESTVPPWEAWIQENILDDRGLDHRCYTSRELLWIAEGCLQPMEMIPQNRVNSFSQTLARMGVKKARGADGGSRVKVKIGGKLQPTTIWVMWGGVYSEIGWAKEYEGSRVKVVASNPATNPATDPEKF